MIGHYTTGAGLRHYKAGLLKPWRIDRRFEGVNFTFLAEMSISKDLFSNR